jgi:hypothetical protein
LVVGDLMDPLTFGPGLGEEFASLVLLVGLAVLVIESIVTWARGALRMDGRLDD